MNKILIASDIHGSDDVARDLSKPFMTKTPTHSYCSVI